MRDRRNAFKYLLKSVQTISVHVGRHNLQYFLCYLYPVNIVSFQMVNFCVTYSCEYKEVIKLCQRHGIIPQIRNYRKCTELTVLLLPKVWRSQVGTNTRQFLKFKFSNNFFGSFEKNENFKRISNLLFHFSKQLLIWLSESELGYLRNTAVEI